MRCKVSLVPTDPRLLKMSSLWRLLPWPRRQFTMSFELSNTPKQKITIPLQPHYCRNYQFLLVGKLLVRSLLFLVQRFEIGAQFLAVVFQNLLHFWNFARIGHKDLEDMKGIEGNVRRRVSHQLHDENEVGSGIDVLNHDGVVGPGQ